MQFHNFRAIAYNSYSLGAAEPGKHGIYHLTFVTPYEAKVKLSGDVHMMSNEESGCAAIDSELSILYFDMIFKLGQ